MNEEEINSKSLYIVVVPGSMTLDMIQYLVVYNQTDLYAYVHKLWRYHQSYFTHNLMDGGNLRIFTPKQLPVCSATIIGQACKNCDRRVEYNNCLGFKTNTSMHRQLNTKTTIRSVKIDEAMRSHLEYYDDSRDTVSIYCI